MLSKQTTLEKVRTNNDGCKLSFQKRGKQTLHFETQLEGLCSEVVPMVTQLRREKIDLENTLEQEQEMLVNKLWKRMDKVENEKR